MSTFGRVRLGYRVARSDDLGVTAVWYESARHEWYLAWVVL